MRPRQYYVYILTNRRDGVMYTGMTNDLKRRVFEHKRQEGGGFAKRYNIDRLVYFEVFSDPQSAIVREKQIKAGPRWRKVELVQGVNPQWQDLYNEL